jgi:polyhydroxybutyrate depolymerase
MSRPAVLAAALLALAAPTLAGAGVVTSSFQGRSVIVYTPDHLPPAGQRALVVVLHGGLGNAQRIESAQSESALRMDAEADKDGFVVAYLSGTPVTLRLGPEYLGWNSGGGCCGQSAANNVDDVGYITAAVHDLEGKYGIDPARVFGMGHSNGAMMTQRLLCVTNLYAAAVAISGPLGVAAARCPDARGKRILAIHGQDDRNVPIGGGRGTQGVSGVAFASEAHAHDVFTASGATYDLQIVPGADHKLEHIDAVIQQTEHRTLQHKAAQFFGLSPAGS